MASPSENILLALLIFLSIDISAPSSSWPCFQIGKATFDLQNIAALLISVSLAQ
jgi:hypothetical protein